MPEAPCTLVLRGKNEIGDDLVISCDYIAHSIRERASELLTLEFGPLIENQIRSPCLGRGIRGSRCRAGK